MLTRTRKAFTLLELMVAFVIMAILAAVAIPSLQSIVSNSQLQADQSTALNLAHAAYFNAQSVYPAGSVTVAGLTNASSTTVNTATTSNSDIVGQANNTAVSGITGWYLGGTITGSFSGKLASGTGTATGWDGNVWITFTHDNVCIDLGSSYPSLNTAATSQATC